MYYRSFGLSARRRRARLGQHDQENGKQRLVNQGDPAADRKWLLDTYAECRDGLPVAGRTK